MSAPVRAVLALGSNLGGRSSTLRDAVAELVADPAIQLLRVSPLAQTEPVGGPAGQPAFLNLVMEVETTLEPLELLRRCQGVEQNHHRTREVRWGPRTLDIDVITYADLVSEEEVLTLPHPRAAERAFVLQPWAWMDPEATLGGRPVAELAAAAADLEGLSPYLPDEDG